MGECAGAGAKALAAADITQQQAVSAAVPWPCPVTLLHWPAWERSRLLCRSCGLLKAPCACLLDPIPCRFQQALALQASTSSQLSTSTNLLGPLQLPLAPLQAFVNQADSQLDSAAAAAGDLSQSLGGADDVPGVVRDAAAELETSLTVSRGAAGSNSAACLRGETLCQGVPLRAGC